MNILILNHYAGSPTMGMEYRPYYFAREWNKMGHHTYIMASSVSHVRTHQPGVSGDFEQQQIEGVDYIWVKTPDYKENNIKRIFNILMFIRKVFFGVRKIVKKYKFDVIIASSTYPLDIFPAKKLAKKTGAKLVYEVHDLWPLSPIELGGYSKNHPYIRLLQYAENYAYKHADYVVSLLPKTMDYMKGHGMHHAKWNYIPNGINPDEWQNNDPIPESHSNMLRQLKAEGKKLVAYTGTIGLANALDTFLEAAKTYPGNDVVFIIVGKGPEEERLKTRAKEENIQQVIFLPNVPKNTIPNLLSFFDILYIGLKNQSFFRFGISPNKLIDYMMSGKPVIQSINAGNNMVQEANCGLWVEPENAEAVIKAVKQLLSLPQEKLNELGKNGKQFILSNHLYSVLAEKFIKIFNK